MKWLSMMAATALLGCNVFGGDGGQALEVGVDALPTGHPPVVLPRESPGELVAEPVAKRLSIAQLDASIAAVLGNGADGAPIRFLVGATNARVPGYERYGATLGVADYIVAIEDNRDTNLLYAKFAMDGARSGCKAAVAYNFPRAPTDRQFLVNVETTKPTLTQINDGVRSLVKVAWVRDLPADHPRIVALSQLAKDAGATSTSASIRQSAWEAVCVALLTAAEFHTY